MRILHFALMFVIVAACSKTSQAAATLLSFGSDVSLATEEVLFTLNYDEQPVLGGDADAPDAADKVQLKIIFDTDESFLPEPPLEVVVSHSFPPGTPGVSSIDTVNPITEQVLRLGRSPQFIADIPYVLNGPQMQFILTFDHLQDFDGSFRYELADLVGNGAQRRHLFIAQSGVQYDLADFPPIPEPSTWVLGSLCSILALAKLVRTQRRCRA